MACVGNTGLPMFGCCAPAVAGSFGSLAAGYRYGWAQLTGNPTADFETGFRQWRTLTTWTEIYIGYDTAQPQSAIWPYYHRSTPVRRDEVITANAATGDRSTSTTDTGAFGDLITATGAHPDLLWFPTRTVVDQITDTVCQISLYGDAGDGYPAFGLMARGHYVLSGSLPDPRQPAIAAVIAAGVSAIDGSSTVIAVPGIDYFSSRDGSTPSPIGSEIPAAFASFGADIITAGPMLLTQFHGARPDLIYCSFRASKVVYVANQWKRVKKFKRNYQGPGRVQYECVGQITPGTNAVVNPEWPDANTVSMDATIEYFTAQADSAC